jgi:hypothetical protein
MVLFKSTLELEKYYEYLADYADVAVGRLGVAEGAGNILDVDWYVRLAVSD